MNLRTWTLFLLAQFLAVKGFEVMTIEANHPHNEDAVVNEHSSSHVSSAMNAEEEAKIVAENLIRSMSFPTEPIDLSHHLHGLVNVGSPTLAPTEEPTAEPTESPTAIPTAIPTAVPTAVPTAAPTDTPTLNPTAAPTMIPTAVPTQSPTITLAPTSSIQTSVSFNASQNLNNMNSSTYQKNEAQNNQAFQESVASTITGTTSDDVHITSVTDAVTNAQAHFTSLFLRGGGSDKVIDMSFSVQSTGQAVFIKYVIVLPPNLVAIYPNATAAYQASKSMLVTAVNSGVFTTTLQSIAMSYGLTALAQANSTAIEVSEPVYDTTIYTSSSSNKDKLSKGDIAAIVICSFIGFVALLGGIYYCMTYRKKSLQTSSDDNFQVVPNSEL